MKVTIILLAIFASAYSTEFEEFADRSISSSITGTIEKIRSEMPCGFPSMGIPPVAPFKLAEKNIAIDTSELKLNGNVEDLVVNNLNNFEIEKMKVHVFGSKIDYKLLFKDISVDTNYDLNVFLQKGALKVNTEGKGPAKLLIKELSVSGTIKYSLSIFSGKIKLKDLSVIPEINGVVPDIEGLSSGIDEEVNKFLETTLEQIVNQNQDEISDRIENILLPIANGVLQKKSFFFFTESLAEANCAAA